MTNNPHAFRFTFGCNHPDALRALEIQRQRAIKHGQVWSDHHASVMKALQQAYVLTALGLHNGREAWPLAVGTGKTESVVAFAKAQSERAIPLTLLVCMERTAQIRDLHLSMLDAGVPAEMIGVYHRKSAKDVTTEGLPPSAALTEVHQYPFLLVTHSMMMRGDTNIATVNTFKGQPRGVVVWDESLVKAQGHHFDLATMETAVAAFGIHSRDAGEAVKADAKEAHSELSLYLQSVRDVFERHFGASYVAPLHITSESNELSQGTASIVNPVIWADGQLTRYEAAVATVLRETRTTGSLRAQLLELFDCALQPVRVIPYMERSRRAGVIRFDTRIPESLTNLIVLDASHVIRRLTGTHDTTLKAVTMDCSVKSFKDVSVTCIQHGAGKDSLAKSLRNSKSVALKELIERVRAMPADESSLVITFKDEVKDSGRGLSRYVSLTRTALRRAGINVEAVTPSGQPRFTFITWCHRRSKTDPLRRSNFDPPG